MSGPNHDDRPTGPGGADAAGDPFRHFDGAYLLGALDDDDRRAFEAHLETCAECRARVDDLRPTVDVLAGLSLGDLPADAFDDPGPMPDTLLPGLLRRAGRERARRRWLTSAVGVAAAACLVALAVVVWPSGGNGPARPAEQALSAVRPSPVSATARLVSKAWGTEIDLHCKYKDDVEAYLPYGLVVVDTSGVAHPAGTWTLIPEQAITFTGGTSVPRDHIATVQITRPDGVPILELDV